MRHVATFGGLLAVFPFNVLKHMTRGDAKVIYSTLDHRSISWSLNIRFPAPFSAFSDFLTVLQFNFISLNCVGMPAETGGESRISPR